MLLYSSFMPPQSYGNGPAPSPDFAVVATQTDSNATAVSTRTFSGVSFGAEDANRVLVIEVASRVTTATTGTLTSVTAGGVTLTLAAAQTNGTSTVAVYFGTVPTGTTGNVVLTYSGGQTRWAIKVYRGLGPVRLDGTDNVSLPGTGTLSTTVVGGGSTFCAAVCSDPAVDMTMSGITNAEANLSAGTGHNSSFGFKNTGHDTITPAITFASSVSEKMATATLKQDSISPLNIAVVTNDTTNASATNTKAALETFGHTVTLIADSAIGSTNFSSYNVIVAVRPTGTSTTAVSSTVASGLQSLLDGGKPMVLGGTFSTQTVGTGRTTLWTAMNLTGTCRGTTNSSGGEISVTDNSHAVTYGFSTGKLPISTGTSAPQTTVTSGQSTVGSSLGLGDPDVSGSSGDVALIAIPAGTSDLIGHTVAARVVICDFYGSFAYRNIGQSLLNHAVHWAAGNL